MSTRHGLTTRVVFGQANLKHFFWKMIPRGSTPLSKTTSLSVFSGLVTRRLDCTLCLFAVPWINDPPAPVPTGPSVAVPIGLSLRVNLAPGCDPFRLEAVLALVAHGSSGGLRFYARDRVGALPHGSISKVGKPGADLATCGLRV